MEYGKKTDKEEKWEKHLVGPGIRREEREKWEMYTVGPGIWLENWKNVENEKYTL